MIPGVSQAENLQAFADGLPNIVEVAHDHLPIEAHVELLNSYKPDVLLTMPMILENLVNTGNIGFLYFQPNRLRKNLRCDECSGNLENLLGLVWVIQFSIKETTISAAWKSK